MIVSIRRFAPVLGFRGPLGRLALGVGGTIEEILAKLSKYGGDLGKLAATERQALRKYWAEETMGAAASKARGLGDEAGALAFEKKLSELQTRGYKLTPVGESHFMESLKKSIEDRAKGKRPGPVSVPKGKEAAEEAFQAGRGAASTDSEVATLLRQLVEIQRTPGWMKLVENTWRAVRRHPLRSLSALGASAGVAFLFSWWRALGFKAFIHQEAIQAMDGAFFTAKDLRARYTNPKTSNEEAAEILNTLRSQLLTFDDVLNKGDAFFHGDLKYVPWYQDQYIEIGRSYRAKLEVQRQAIKLMPGDRKKAIEDEAEKKKAVEEERKGRAASPKAGAAGSPAIPLTTPIPVGPVAPGEDDTPGSATATQYEMIAKAIQPSEYRGRKYPPLVALTVDAMAAFTTLQLSKAQAEAILEERRKEIDRREEARKRGAVSGMKPAGPVGLKAAGGPVVIAPAPAPAVGPAQGGPPILPPEEDLDPLIMIFIEVKKRTGFKTSKDQNDAVRTGNITASDLKNLIRQAGGADDLAAYEARLKGGK